MLRGLHTRTLTIAGGGGGREGERERSYGGQKIHNQNVLMGWEGGVRGGGRGGGRGMRGGGRRVEGMLVLTYDYVSFVKKKVIFVSWVFKWIDCYYHFLIFFILFSKFFYLKIIGYQSKRSCDRCESIIFSHNYPSSKYKRNKYSPG